MHMFKDSKKGWRPDFARIRGKAYLAIATQIEEAICSGVFQPGDTFPPQRAIAESIGFHVNTVNAAFKEAARRGLVSGHARRGTVVLEQATADDRCDKCGVIVDLRARQPSSVVVDRRGRTDQELPPHGRLLHI